MAEEAMRVDIWIGQMYANYFGKRMHNLIYATHILRPYGWTEYTFKIPTISKMDTRVQDYLDDKLQSSADLESLDSLLDNLKNQQELLKKQVSTSV